MTLSAAVRRLLLAAALAVATAACAPAVDNGGGEAAAIALASAPGPERVRALGLLGTVKPLDVAGVAAALVSGVLDKDLLCRMQAGRSIDQLLRGPDGNGDAAMAAALATHGERLLTAAEGRMSELTNPPIEVLGKLTLPSDLVGARLTRLLSPDAKFRRYTTAALARSRPLTPAIRRTVLAEAGSDPLVQQDLLIAMAGWPVAELAGEDVDGALARIFDSSMGSLPAYILKLVAKRGQPTPLLAARLLVIIADPATHNGLYRHALEGYLACAGRQAADTLAGQLLAVDPRLDPDRFRYALDLLLDRKDLPVPAAKRLTALLADQTQDTWLRHELAKLLATRPTDGPTATLVANLGALTGWPSLPNPASLHLNGTADDDARIAKLGDADHDFAWTLTKAVAAALEPHREDKDFNQRTGAIQGAWLADWAAKHPEDAAHPYVVGLRLRAIVDNYAMTPDERAQGAAYVTSLVGSGFFADPAPATVPYANAGATQLRHAAVAALLWLHQPDTKGYKKGPRIPSRLGHASLETVRVLRAAKAPRLLLLHAERELAWRVRCHLREDGGDPAIYPALLAGCGFALVPVEAFLADAARPGGSTKPEGPKRHQE